MIHRWIVWLVFIAAPLAVGCRSCPHPCDGYSPVQMDGMQSGCADTRAGSILSNPMYIEPMEPMEPMEPIDPMGPIEEIPTPAPAKEDLSGGNQVPGVVILSITDRKLEESSTSDNVATKPLKRKNKGWTARASERNIIR